jgi:hypothetical protein
MFSIKTFKALGVIALLASCTPDPFSINLTNDLDLTRENETVEIALSELPEQITSMIDRIGVYDPSEATFLTTQLIEWLLRPK